MRAVDEEHAGAARIVGEGEHAEHAVDGRLEPGLLAGLAQRRRLGGLTGLDVSGGQVPMVRPGRVAALKEEHALAIGHQRPGPDLRLRVVHEPAVAAGRTLNAISSGCGRQCR